MIEFIHDWIVAILYVGLVFILIMAVAINEGQKRKK